MGPIHKIQRHTVRIKGHKGLAGYICDHPVYIPVISGNDHPFSLICLGHTPDIDCMGLPGYGHPVSVYPKSRGHSGKIFQYILRIVPSGIRKVHRCAVPFAYASKPGGKTVDHKAGFFKNIKGKIRHSSLFSCRKNLRTVFILPLNHRAFSPVSFDQFF